MTPTRSPLTTPDRIIRLLLQQYGVITRQQALAAGMSDGQITGYLRSGRWVRIYQGVYRSADVPRTSEGDLLAACLVTGGRASHQSAGQLWGLVDEKPRRPTISVAAGANGRRAGMTVHRRSTLEAVPGRLRGIPCTRLASTVVDLGAVLAPTAVDDVVDRALAKSDFSARQLITELSASANCGRRGRRAVQRSLDRRGFLGGPDPSVLESKTLRLLDRAGVRPLAREQVVRWEGGWYRLDFVLLPDLALEVDGYAYHATGPAKMRSDHQRRNRLHRLGWTVLVYTWLDIVEDAERVISEVRDAIARHAVRVG